LYSKHIAWIGSLSFLYLAACSGSDESSTPPGFVSGPAGAPSVGAPSVGGTGGQPAVSGSAGGSSGEMVAVNGGLSGVGGTATAGGAPAVDAGSGADAGGGAPADPGGLVGTGPSGLPAPPGPDTVARPAGAPGDITVLNWAGFQGAVTYSFDDNNNSQIQNYDTLQGLGVPFTFYLWTGQPSASNAVWARALADGHEIGNHTLSHNPNMCTPADINSASQFVQNNLGVRTWTMAAPNGAICYKTAATGLFFINRGVSPAQPVLPNDNSDPLNLNCYIPATGQQANVFNANIDDARNRGGWVIYVIHGFTGDGAAYQPVDVNQLTTAVSYTKSLGDIWIGTMVDIGAYWLGQKAFSQAMTSQTGNDRTWTWALPGQFPTGKYLRVRVDGGTLTQNGAPLTWDPHGYYEVALDAGSVTLSP
jgi:polysaccharide deacetylase